MRRVTLALTLALLILLGVIWVSTLPENDKPSLPQGAPPSIAGHITAAVNDTEEPEEIEKEAEVRVARDAFEPIEPVQKRRQGSAAPGRKFLAVRLKVEVLVLHDGRPVEGARVAGVRVLFHPNGKPASMSKRVIGRASTPLSANKPTSDDGSTEATLTFPGDPNDDTPVSVGAYHPEIGSGYAERTLGEIKRAGPVVIELSTGEVVMGRVIDEAGNPVMGAGVKLGTLWHEDSPSLDGVEVLSKEDGTFYIPGIRFGNIPTGLRVLYDDPHPRFAEMQHAWRVPTLRREALVKISEENRRDDGKTWDVGDVVIKEDREFKRRLSEVRQKWSRGDESPGRVGVNKTGSETGDR